MEATGIVLAGGRSSRFGRDKLKEPLDGEPLLHHAITPLVGLCRSVVVVLAPAASEPTLPWAAQVRFVHDDVVDEGPLRGAATGLRADDDDWGVLVGGDMPSVPPAVLELLLDAAQGHDGAALEDGGTIRPLPCVLRTAPARARSEELLARGERRLRALVEALAVALVAEDRWTALDPDRRTLIDVDEPADLDRLAGDEA